MSPPHAPPLPLPRACLSCGYDLRAHPAPTLCPECGTLAPSDGFLLHGTAVRPSAPSTSPTASSDNFILLAFFAAGLPIDVRVLVLIIGVVTSRLALALQAHDLPFLSSTPRDPDAPDTLTLDPSGIHLHVPSPTDPLTFHLPYSQGHFLRVENQGLHRIVLLSGPRGTTTRFKPGYQQVLRFRTRLDAAAAKAVEAYATALFTSSPPLPPPPAPLPPDASFVLDILPASHRPEFVAFCAVVLTTILTVLGWAFTTSRPHAAPSAYFVLFLAAVMFAFRWRKSRPAFINDPRRRQVFHLTPAGFDVTTAADPHPVLTPWHLRRSFAITVPPFDHPSITFFRRLGPLPLWRETYLVRLPTPTAQALDPLILHWQTTSPPTPR